MLALAVPAAVGAIVVGRPMIRLLFERGKYDAAAGDLTYEVLAVYALALPAYVAIELLTRVLIALGDARTPLVSSIVRLAGRTVVTMSLVAGIGAVAIPAAFAATGAGEALVLGLIVWIALRHRAAARSPSPDTVP
jgi:putative peptidoglycan lipid II flippase